jgi:hypothetical protein
MPTTRPHRFEPELARLAIAQDRQATLRREAADERAAASAHRRIGGARGWQFGRRLADALSRVMPERRPRPFEVATRERG